jgi:Aspartyl protease
MPEDFLMDSGADRTVLSASLLTRLRLPTQSPPPKLSLSGVGGSSAFVIVTTVVEFSREDGGTVRMRGEFAGFTDIDATDLSVLGRNVLDHFDVLLSRGVTKWSSSPSGIAIALNRRDGACGNWHVPGDYYPPP